MQDYISHIIFWNFLARLEEMVNKFENVIEKLIL